MRSREILEKAILGACLLESTCYPQVMDIIKPKNFYDQFHATVFEVMEVLNSTSRPINLLTVYQKIPNSASKLVEITAYVSSTALIRNHAFLLLEHSFRESFITLLSNLQSQTDKLTVKSAINDLIDTALDGDIFEMVEDSQSYLQQIGATQEADQVAKLDFDITIRIEKIKEQAKVETLFNELSNLIPTPTGTVHLAMAKIVDLTKAILFNNIDQKQLTKLLEL